MGVAPIAGVPVGEKHATGADEADFMAGTSPSLTAMVQNTQQGQAEMKM